MFYDIYFENTQVKHKTKLISLQTQCNVSTFVDKLLSLCLNHVDLINMLQKVI